MDGREIRKQDGCERGTTGIRSDSGTGYWMSFELYTCAYRFYRSKTLNLLVLFDLTFYEGEGGGKERNCEYTDSQIVYQPRTGWISMEINP